MPVYLWFATGGILGFLSGYAISSIARDEN